MGIRGQRGHLRTIILVPPALACSGPMKSNRNPYSAERERECVQHLIMIVQQRDGDQHLLSDSFAAFDSGKHQTTLLRQSSQLLRMFENLHIYTHIYIHAQRDIHTYISIYMHIYRHTYFDLVFPGRFLGDLQALTSIGISISLAAGPG